MYLQYADDRHFEVAIGVIDKTDGVVEFRRHMWIGDTKDGGASDWIPNVGGKVMERWHEAPNVSARLDSGWTDKAVSDVSSDTDKLRAHCHCGGVEFYITRPNSDSLAAESPFADLLVPYHLGSSENPDNEPWWLRGDKNKNEDKGYTRYLAGNCACNSCRLSSGYEFVQWAFVPTANIELNNGNDTSSIPFKREFGTLKAYQSKPGVTRRFCGRCGATAFWDGDWRPTLIDVGVGLLDAPSGARAEEWLDWETSRVSFREFAHNHALIDGLEDGIRAWGREA